MTTTMSFYAIAFTFNSNSDSNGVTRGASLITHNSDYAPTACYVLLSGVPPVVARLFARLQGVDCLVFS